MQEEGQGRRGSTPPAAKDRAGSAQAASTQGEGGPGWRVDRGPRLVSSLLPQITRPAFKKRSPAAAQLIADWAAIVGPVVAAQTVPRNVSAGTLTIACSGPVAMELQYLAPQLIGRINTAMGQALVQKLRFVQAALKPPPPRPQKPKPMALPERVEASLEQVADPELREALARLAQGVYRGRR